MATVQHISNPYMRSEIAESWSVYDEPTIRQWLTRVYGEGFVDFDMPTVCLLNGEPVLRSEWSHQLISLEDRLDFITLAGGPALIFVVVIVAIVALAVALSLIDIPTITDLQDADPVYSLSGQTNQNRLANPIEVPYGRVRLYPSYGASPYNLYSGNSQFQYQLFCLGQGEYEVEELRLDDTPADNYEDVEYEFYGPNERVTLFPDNVVTAVEVAGIELYGSNEDEYPAENGGHFGPYVANEPNSLANRLEVDVTLPRGLYESNDDGGLDTLSASFLIQYREIDSEGFPLLGWETLINHTFSLRTVTPQRFTFGANVPEGRYELRGRRTGQASDSHRVGDTIVWERLRAFLPSTRDYGDVTMLAVRALSSSELNDATANRINVIATRKLPIYDSSSNTWSEPQPTRSIVWAFCDIFRKRYGGALSDNFLDLKSLSELDTIYEARNNFFDWVFDQNATVWESAKVVALCGRGIPMLNGTKITLVRDSPKTVPVGVFTPDNIISGSFTWEIKLSNIDDFDGVQIEYVDPDTWTIETVDCLLPDDEGVNLRKVTLAGSTSRQHAYEEGIYMRLRDRLRSQNIQFTTGLEGLIPTYGDFIAISHDIPRWGTAGVAQAYVGNILHVDKALEFKEGEVHQVLIRTKDGGGIGPFEVVAGPYSNQIELLDSPSLELDFSSFTENPFFLFGVSEELSQSALIISLTPEQDNTVKVVATNYDADVYSYDGVEAPPLGDSSVAVEIPDLPIVESISVSPLGSDRSFAQVSWTPALGAHSYTLQQSYDGIAWDDVATLSNTFYLLPVSFGVIHLRVAAINRGKGPYTTTVSDIGESTTLPSPVTNLVVSFPFVGEDTAILWNRSSLASFYVVTVRENDENGAVLRQSEVAATNYSYSFSRAQQDGATSRSFHFEVQSASSAGASQGSSIIATNTAPLPVSGISSQIISQDDVQAFIEVSWSRDLSQDFNRYLGWLSPVQGFEPDSSSIEYQGTASTIILSVSKEGDGSIPQHYVRIAALDIWNEDYNLSVEHALPT